MQYDSVGRPYPRFLIQMTVLRAKEHLGRPLPNCSIAKTICELLLSHKLYQMALAHCSFSCRLQMVSRAAQVPIRGLSI